MKNFITASEARKKNLEYKEKIRQRAISYFKSEISRNIESAIIQDKFYTSVYYNKDVLNSKDINIIIADLENKGYKVKKNFYENTLTIDWS